MHDSRIRVALIGCGRIAYKHIEALSALCQGYQLVGVCDVVEERAVSKAKAYQEAVSAATHTPMDIPEIYTDYSRMLEELDFDLGVVATESGLHYTHVMDLLRADRNVLVEKPIALSTAHAEEMIELATGKGLILGVCHQNRFNPPIQMLRQAVEEGRFGKVVNGTARILWTRDMGYYEQAPWRGTARMDGGTLMNQCIHNIDLLIWMMDSPIETVYAQTGTFLRNIEMEDFGALIIRFESGAIGIVEGSACVYPKNLEETLSLFGESGTAVIGGLAVNEIQTWQFKESSGADQETSHTREAIDNVYGNGHLRLYENLRGALSGKGSLLIDGCAGAQAMKVVLAAYQSQAEGRAINFKTLNYATVDALRGKTHE